MKIKLLFLCFLLSLPLWGKKKLVDYVNTLQGTASSFDLSRGNTYPCVAMPWGMNFWTAQTGKNGSGWIYTYDADSIRGFRQTHQCSPWTKDYGTFSIMPVSGELRIGEYERAAKFNHKNEVAKPYSYKVVFDNSLSAEIAPTERGSWMQFRFPKKAQKHIIIDAYKGGGMVKIIPKEQKIIGYCKNTNHSTAHLPHFANFFVIFFDKQIKSHGVWKNEDRISSISLNEISGHHIGAYLEFDSDVVNVRIASSFINIEQAEINLKKELSDIKDIESVKQKAQKAWNTQLGKIVVEGGSEEQLATFYSCLFRSMLFPRQFFEYDITGEPIYFSPYDGKIHRGYMYTDTGFWDTFRAQLPLNAILHPQMHERYIQSLMDAYEQSGWLPSWSFPGHNGGMIGNHAFSIITDAYVKGFRNIDARKALDAMYHDATQKGPFGPSIGRSAASDYSLLGYVPHDRSRNEGREATAKTLEYAYNDFCAMTLAQKVKYKEMEDFFSKSIFNYKNVYDSTVKFMRGRLADGTWDQEFNPIKWGDPFTEANAWHYTWSVFHDVQGLIDLLGGKHNFVAKLDSVFHTPNDVDVGSYSVMIHEMAEMKMINMGQYAHGNQPIQHMPYLYNYASAPWKTQHWVRQIMNRLYSSGVDGFCGDEDQGQMSAWYIISALGLYAVCPGTDEYVIGSPLFPKVTINLENENQFVIEANENSHKNVYIHSAILNTQIFTKNYIHYSDILKGGKLKFEMTNVPNYTRGINNEDVPFSVTKNK